MNDLIWNVVYSKLIINCSVKQRSLSNETIFGSACSEARPVVETVARIGFLDMDGTLDFDRFLDQGRPE